MLAVIAKFTLFPCLALIFRARIHGKRPKLKGPAIIAVNHISRVDGILISHLFTLKRLKFMVIKTIFRKPLHGFFSRLMGMYPAEGYDSSLKLLDKGETIVIFPEGTRSPYEIKPFQPGAIVLAMESGAPIYPVRIHRPLSYTKRTDVTFGEPIYYEKPTHALTPALLKEKAEELRQIIKTL